MRYSKTHTKQSYNNPQFGCNLLNEFYAGKTVQMHDTVMSGLSSYNDYTMLSGIDGCDLIGHVFKYHKYIPESFELFEFLLNSDIDINMNDKNTTGSLFVSLIFSNELKWLSKYMSGKWFDDSLISKIYLFESTNMTPLQYTVIRNQLPMFNLLMQHGAVPYNGIENDLYRFSKLTSTVKIRELLEIYKFLGISDPMEKIFGIYLRSYRLDATINKYFMKQTFDINYKINDKNYLMILMSADYERKNETLELVTWMVQNNIDVNYVNSAGHDVVHYTIKHTFVNVDVLIVLINAGAKINDLKEILTRITQVDGIHLELLEILIPKMQPEEVTDILNFLSDIYVRITYVHIINCNIFDQFGFDSNIIKTLRNAKAKAILEAQNKKKERLKKLQEEMAENKRRKQERRNPKRF